MRIAVIDDEAVVRKRLEEALTKEKKHQVKTFASAEDFLNALETIPFDLAFLDIVLPEMNGMEALRHVKERYPATEIILMTGFASIESAIQGIKMGAFHYVSKPLKLVEIRNLARKALEHKKLAEQNRSLRARLEPTSGWRGMIGTSTSMKKIFELIRKVAPLDCNVLIRGESGTGKELVARAVHEESTRSGHPFMAFNCGGFTEELITNELFGHERGAFTGASTTKVGLLESAHRGTVFMDEIGDMPMPMQGKLLRVIQEKRIFRVGGTRPIHLDIRFIAASNKDLKRAVKEGTFREDLFFRLNVVQIPLPRLTERRQDIPLLIRFFLDRFNQEFGKAVQDVEPEVRDILMGYGYPGNVRELENTIERAVALSDSKKLIIEDLPSELQAVSKSREQEWGTLEEQEQRYIRKILEVTGYNIAQTARILDLPRTTLWRKMKRYGLSRS